MSWTAMMLIGEPRPLDEWPEVVDVARVETDEHRTYVPERTASIVKVPHKDYISIGHYECGLCGASITPVMRYCHGCGARLKGANE